MKKLFLYLSTFMILGIKPVLAAVPGPGVPNIDGFFGFLQTILLNVSKLVSFGWVGSENIVVFLKFLLWILVFTILFAVGQLVFAKFGDGKQGRKLALVVSLVLATSTTILTPGSLVLTLFSTYSSLILFVFMGAALIGIIKLLYGDWLTNTVGTGPILHIARILGLILCWWILASITQAADSATGIRTFAVPLLLTLINIKREN